jgi:hypothetical protein
MNERKADEATATVRGMEGLDGLVGLIEKLAPSVAASVALKDPKLAKRIMAQRDFLVFLRDAK